jgi:multisubunit Na+/H+ antiporter MnhB subunit
VDSVIIRIAARAFSPLLIVLALYLLYVGHNLPGGGFVAGLLFGAAFVLYAVAHGALQARRTLVVDPRTWLGVGLCIAAGSSVLALTLDQPWFTGVWVLEPLPLGSPVLFDVGVCMVVASVVVLMTVGLLEE